MDELAKEAKGKEAKDRGAGGATGEIEQEGGRGSSSTEVSGNHQKETAEEYTGESGIPNHW